MEIVNPILPDELVRDCLLRVSYKSHEKLKAVCRKWESTVNSPRFYADRKITGTTEHFICLIQATDKHPAVADKKLKIPPSYGITVYDPVKATWESLSPIPFFPLGIPLFSQCVYVNQKLLLIGGWHPSLWVAMKTVFIYDFVSGTWQRGADMPTTRSFFACSVSSSTGLVYIAGGHDEDKNALRALEAYNVGEDRWETLPGMRQERDECQGVFMDGKFFAISGYKTESQGRFDSSAEVFDPNTGIWSSLEDMWSIGGYIRSCVAACGHLYSFHKQQIMKYDVEKNVWTAVASLPESIHAVTCAVEWRDWIFVSGSAPNDDGQQNFYLFKPSTGESIAVDRPKLFQGFVQSAVMVEI